MNDEADRLSAVLDEIKVLQSNDEIEGAHVCVMLKNGEVRQVFYNVETNRLEWIGIMELTKSKILGGLRWN